MSRAPRRPSDDALRTAAEWLDVNEGDEGEGDDCRAVADWLRRQIEEARVRKIARETGFPVKVVRKLLAEDEGP